MPTVSNTSPLIWLSKVGKLNLLKSLFGEIIISQETYREAVEVGLKESYSDALVIKEACEQGWINVKCLDDKQLASCQKMMQQTFELHGGEVQAVMLAREFDRDALLLMDDSAGRAFAEAWGLKVRGTLFVILDAIRRGMLGKAEAKETLLILVQKGFRVEPKFLARVLAEIENLPT
jgi:Predicted nucleic acid-binding protein, contains PIN domain